MFVSRWLSYCQQAAMAEMRQQQQQQQQLAARAPRVFVLPLQARVQTTRRELMGHRSITLYQPQASYAQPTLAARKRVIDNGESSAHSTPISSFVSSPCQSSPHAVPSLVSSSVSVLPEHEVNHSGTPCSLPRDSSLRTRARATIQNDSVQLPGHITLQQQARTTTAAISVTATTTPLPPQSPLSLSSSSSVSSTRSLPFVNHSHDTMPSQPEHEWKQKFDHHCSLFPNEAPASDWWKHVGQILSRYQRPRSAPPSPLLAASSDLGCTTSRSIVHDTRPKLKGSGFGSSLPSCLSPISLSSLSPASSSSSHSSPSLPLPASPVFLDAQIRGNADAVTTSYFKRLSQLFIALDAALINSSARSSHAAPITTTQTADTAALMTSRKTQKTATTISPLPPLVSVAKPITAIPFEAVRVDKTNTAVAKDGTPIDDDNNNTTAKQQQKQQQHVSAPRENRKNMSDSYLGKQIEQKTGGVTFRQATRSVFESTRQRLTPEDLFHLMWILPNSYKCIPRMPSLSKTDTRKRSSSTLTMTTTTRIDSSSNYDDDGDGDVYIFPIFEEEHDATYSRGGWDLRRQRFDAMAKALEDSCIDSFVQALPPNTSLAHADMYWSMYGDRWIETVSASCITDLYPVGTGKDVGKYKDLPTDGRPTKKPNIAK